jgi:hypothetical protein
MDEDWWLQDLLAAVPAVEARCSGFGVRAGPDQAAILGQNMDLRGLDGLQLLLDIRQDEHPRILAPTVAGMVATNAFNEHGIGVCVNTLRQLPTSRQGLPVAFVIRAVASTTTFADAVRLVRSVPHASGQNYIVGSTEGVRCFECSGAAVVEYAPGNRIGHANHSLAQPTGAVAGANSMARQAHVDRRLQELGTVAIADAKAFLAEPPVCRGRSEDDKGSTTLYSVIMEPAPRRLWLTAGPPDQYPYRRFDMVRPRARH